MSCECRCCLAGKPCAHKLLLSPQDARKARDLWAAVCQPDGTYVPRVIDLSVKPSGSTGSKEPPELGEIVECESCGGEYAMPVYLVAFLRQQRAPMPECAACRANAQTEWTAA